MRSNKNFKTWLVATVCASSLFCVSAVSAQDGTPGVSGSSPGSEGMPDRESDYSARVDAAYKKGKNSLEHIASLLALGMHYNRSSNFVKASKTLRNALAIIDSGAIKPTPSSSRRPERTIEKHHPGGVVSAEVVRVPMPYEETLQELLPQLISAELEANELTVVESHIKRLIALKGPNQVSDKLALMSAYHSYSQLMRRKHRLKEAANFQRKADEINSSFKPM